MIKRKLSFLDVIASQPILRQHRREEIFTQLRSKENVLQCRNDRKASINWDKLVQLSKSIDRMYKKKRKKEERSK